MKQHQKHRERNTCRNTKNSGFSFEFKDLLLIIKAIHKAFWKIFIPYFKDLMIRGLFKDKASPLEIYFLVAVIGSLEVVLIKTIQFIARLLANF